MDTNWSSGPDEGNRLIEQTFLHKIEANLLELYDHTQVQALIQAIEARQAELEASYAGWLTDEQSRAHLRFSALLLAGYQQLQAILPKERALAMLRQAFIEPMQQAVQAGTRSVLNEAADPFEAITKISKARETYYYGPSFTFERIQDDSHAYLLNIRSCFYHTFMAANAALELMPILCDWDTSTWASAIDPAQHGFGFERPTTLGYGGPMCRLWFIRRSSSPSESDSSGKQETAAQL